MVGVRSRRGRVLELLVRVGVLLVRRAAGGVVVHDPLARSGRRQRPAVPAGQHLVGVHRRVGNAVGLGQRRALQEAGVGDGVQYRARAEHVDGQPAAMQGVPAGGHVVPHLEPDTSGHVLQMQRRGRAGHDVGVAGRGVGQLVVQLRGAVVARDGEPHGPQGGRRRAAGVTVVLGRGDPGHVAHVLLELERGRVRVQVEDGERVFVAEAEHAVGVVAARRCRRERGSVDRAADPRLAGHRVVEAGDDDRGRDVGNAFELGHVRDPQVDDQAEPAQQRRQVADHRRPPVEVRRSLDDGRSGRPGRLVLVGPFLLRALVVPPSQVGVAGQQQGRGGDGRVRRSSPTSAASPAYPRPGRRAAR